MFQLEKTKKESARKAYFDSEKAEAARAEGNEFFKKGKFPEAIKCYDEGMKRTPDDDKVKKDFDPHAFEIHQVILMIKRGAKI